jgi:hypothetical protein
MISDAARIEYGLIVLRAKVLLSWAALVAGCGASPSAPETLTQTSDGGAVQARVHFEGGVQHGPNTLSIELSPLRSEGSDATLESVSAAMPGHGHTAKATSVREKDGAFEAAIDLFMTGRWQLELALDSSSGSDRVVMAVDVP